MTNEVKPNIAEKARLRESIAHEVQRYLERDGRITVIESPKAPREQPKGSAWHGAIDIDLLLD